MSGTGRKKKKGGEEEEERKRRERRSGMRRNRVESGESRSIETSTSIESALKNRVRAKGENVTRAVEKS